jgi:DNA relaxase NicK
MSQRNATLIEDLRGGATCYVGSRKSQQFARIYNKAAESGEERYQNCWRYEVQLKNDLATKAAAIFAEVEYTQQTMAAIFVRQWLRRRNVSTPWRSEAELTALPTIDPKNTDVERTLDWLRHTVAPSLRRLKKLGLYDSILEALDLDERE